MRKTLKSEIGITLVALVVTIIVLLILAGVTITSLLGENGIIAKAQQAVDITNTAIQEEQEAINDLLDELNNIINGDGNGTGGDDTPEEPENEQEAIEINQENLDLATLNEEQKNIDGYYLIKNDCVITDSGVGGSITSTGEKVLVIADNVVCNIQGGTFNGTVELQGSATLRLEGGEINGNVNSKDSSNLIISERRN